jgi:hypothetical protein
MQSVRITTDVVSSNIAEILFKVAINIIKHTNKTNLTNSGELLTVVGGLL